MLTDTVLMIRPCSFGYNDETAASNAFMHKPLEDVHQKALKEFNDFYQLLLENNVDVLVFDDTLKPHTPDSIFPNNWFSTHASGEIVLYPMEAINRREERRMDIVERLMNSFQPSYLRDLSDFEKEEKYLEGTGSLVLDRTHKKAYICLSSRSHKEVIKAWQGIFKDYEIITFDASDFHGLPIYHTNVLMCMGDNFVVICLDAIKESLAKDSLLESLKTDGKTIINISYHQMSHFAGNMLLIQNKSKEPILVMSKQAYESLDAQQVKLLSNNRKILTPQLDTIEQTAGGSARCMLAEIFY